MTVVDDARETNRANARLTPEQAAIVEANTALVWWVVNRWHSKASDDDKEEKVADGMLGLIRAAQLFDPAKGFTFSTYATNWIRATIQRGHAVAEGHGFRYMTGYSTSGKTAKGEYHRPTSLDRPLGEDDGATVGEMIADDTVDVEETALTRAHVEQLQAALLRACRDPLDLEVVESITSRESLKVIAARHDVTFEATRQRRERVLARVRHPVYGLVARIPKAKEAAMTDLATARTNGQTGGPPFLCTDPGCHQTFDTPQGLGSHRRYTHGAGFSRDREVSRAGKVKKTRPPVHVELVDEDPPPPVLKPLKIADIDRIMAVIEEAEMPAGKWKRCAIFVSARAARSMATRLRKKTEGGPYEWYAPGDDRLFVRVRPDE